MSEVNSALASRKLSLVTPSLLTALAKAGKSFGNYSRFLTNQFRMSSIMYKSLGSKSYITPVPVILLFKTIFGARFDYYRTLKSFS